PRAQLADGGGLARAIDAHDQYYEGLGGRIDHERLFYGRQDLRHRLVKRLEQSIDIVKLLACHALAQLLENSRGGLDADIGGDQPRFQLVQNLGVDFASRQQVRNIGGQPRGSLIQLGAQALEKSAHAWTFSFIRHRTV